jgi:hypothetical protein
MAIGKTLLLLLAFSSPAWGRVFVYWSTPGLPSASSLGVNDIVYSWRDGLSPQLEAAHKQGYRVYLEVPVAQARAAARQASKAGCTGVILTNPESGNTSSEKEVAALQLAFRHLKFLLLNPNGKPPDMRGSLIIKRDAVLEVSSPTAQPWIDTNLALIKVEQRARSGEVPLYTFSWDDQEQQRTLTADDYSLAVAESGAFHADLVLKLEEHLQQALHNRDREAWRLWNQVRSILNFSPKAAEETLKPAANVAVVVDQLDTSDEVLNLLSRHNIPFQMFLTADLKAEDLKGFDILILFAKADKEAEERINGFAASGMTVVVVDEHSSHAWQNSQPAHLNEHTTSYAVGRGKVLELSEPVTDPETFARDIRRLLGKRNALLTLWNGLTTVAVPYERDGRARVIEFVNYAAEPVRVQVQVKGLFASVRYESPEEPCCKTLVPVEHDGVTEFVIPDLRIAGRVHLGPQ